jgi:hypothetical protein
MNTSTPVIAREWLPARAACALPLAPESAAPPEGELGQKGGILAVNRTSSHSFDAA